MAFGVSMNEKGKFVPEKFPKNERNSAESVLLPEPVLPKRKYTKFGSNPALFKNSFKGVKNVYAKRGYIIFLVPIFQEY